MAAKEDQKRRADRGMPVADEDRVMQAYRTLRELIVHGRLAPGTRIVEREVARRLGISRTPVHGAVQRLQQEGYVVAPPDGPPTRPLVAPLTREDAREVFEIVAELEGFAARRAAALDPAPRKALVGTMTRINTELVAISGTSHPDPNRRFENDTEFHRCTWKPAPGQAVVLRWITGYLRPGGRLLLVEYDQTRGNRWVPFPVPPERFRRLAPEAGQRAPQELGRRHSAYGREMYAAATRMLDVSTN